MENFEKVIEMQYNMKRIEAANNYNTESTESIDLDNKPKYVDYDNRPIKPLDQNVLNEKLSEYTEMSKEEMENLRKKYKFVC